MRDWNGQKVVIIGVARQGMALARYLVGKGAQVTLTDRRPAADLLAEQQALSDLPVSWVLGGHPLSLLDGAGWLCLSGSVPLSLPLVVEARARGIPLTNDSQIFLEAAPCTVIGITGSAGKTTTTTLVGRIAQESSRLKGEGLNPDIFQATLPNWAYIGGNIGTPLVSAVDEMKPDDLAVMELSSFQLEIMTRSPQVAAVLNITPNHLDRHGTMEAYTAAKARILEFQAPGDAAVLGRDDPGAWSLAAQVRGRLLTFGLGQLAEGQEGTYVSGDDLYLRTLQKSDIRLMDRSAVRLRGDHNLLNVLAACAIAAAAGLPSAAMQAAVTGFSGVPHRLEFVRTWGGADWYNDSIATAPERAMAAIRSFDEPLVLLAGGRDKDLPWEDFAALVSRRVDHLIVFGEAAEKILGVFNARTGSLAGAGPSERQLTITRCAGLRQAVQNAARIVQPGDVVLLSPGGTSFDEFMDFEERGACFARLVNELP